MEMKTKRFAPGLTPTIFTLLALLILVGLGTWQAGKVGPKTALLERIQTGMEAEPIALPFHVDDPTALEYRRVSFEGRVLSTEPAHLFGTNLAGQPGYYLYAPVARPVGMTVIVNFGWIPFEKKGEVTLPTVNEMMINGVLLRSAAAGPMTPENQPEGDAWYTADVHALAEHFGLRTKEYYHFRVFADGNEGGVPLGGQVRVAIPNNHLEYAFTWYGLALSLLGVFIVFGLRQGRKAEANAT